MILSKLKIATALILTFFFLGCTMDGNREPSSSEGSVWCASESLHNEQGEYQGCRVQVRKHANILPEVLEKDCANHCSKYQRPQPPDSGKPGVVID